MQMPRQAHHKRQLDLFLEEPAFHNDKLQSIMSSSKQGEDSSRKGNWRHTGPENNIDNLENLLCSQDCTVEPKSLTYLSPEFTTAAGTERPRNAIRPLMKPGKFCAANKL